MVSNIQNNTKAVEDYLKAIYLLVDAGELVTTNALSRRLDVRPASVTGMLKKLAGSKLIRYQPYKNIELTKAGQKIALEMIRHHRLIELFLAEALEMDWEDVHDEAEKLEHVISEKLEDKIDQVLGYPKFDPHGDPIPARDGTCKHRELMDLSNCGEGQNVKVARVLNQSTDVLRYLGDIGLKPGIELTVCRKEPLAGPITIALENNEQVLANSIASQIRVELCIS